MSCPRPDVPNLDPKSWWDVHAPLRDLLWTARLHAAQVGLILYLNSGGRSDGQQWDLRHYRCPGRECDRSCKGVPTTALPGSSHHRNISELIAAADMAGTGLNWLHAHRLDYAIHFPVPGEAWHAEWTGNAPRVPIIKYPNLIDTTGHETPPRPLPTPTEELTMDAEAKAAFAALSDQVKALREEVNAVRSTALIAVDEGRQHYGSLRGWEAAMAEVMAQQAGIDYKQIRTRAGELDTHVHPGAGH